MRFVFTPNGWEDYAFWQATDRATLKRINCLLDGVARDEVAVAHREGAGQATALLCAVAKAAAAPAHVTHIEVTLARPGRIMALADLTRARVNDFRGLMGIELRAPGLLARIGP